MDIHRVKEGHNSSAVRLSREAFAVLKGAVTDGAIASFSVPSK